MPQSTLKNMFRERFCREKTMQMLRRNGSIRNTTNQLFLVVTIFLLQAVFNCACSQVAKVNSDTSIGKKIFLDDFESISKALVIQDGDFKVDAKND